MVKRGGVGKIEQDQKTKILLRKDVFSEEIKIGFVKKENGFSFFS